MIKNPIIHGVLALATLVMCGDCNVISQLPVITASRPTWNASSPEKRLAAAIVQNNGPLNASLRVRCEFFFRTHSQVPNLRSIDAERLAGNVFNCLLPTNLVIRNNHVLVFEWLVESVNTQGGATPVARSGQKEFHVGCDNPEQRLRNEQAEVLNRFGWITTTVDMVEAGYVPTHPTTTSVGLSLVATNKVFRGMGAAFAKADEVLEAGDFVPSGLPQLGRPSLLLFLPSQTVGGRPDLAHPSATYSLIGWAYAVNLSTAPSVPAAGARRVQVEASSGIAHLYVDPALPAAERAAQVEALRKDVEGLARLGASLLDEVFVRSGLARVQLDNPRSGDLVVLVAPGAEFSDAGTDVVGTPRQEGGTAIEAAPRPSTRASWRWDRGSRARALRRSRFSLSRPPWRAPSASSPPEGDDVDFPLWAASAVESRLRRPQIRLEDAHA